MIKDETVFALGCDQDAVIHQAKVWGNLWAGDLRDGVRRCLPWSESDVRAGEGTRVLLPGDSAAIG